MFIIIDKVDTAKHMPACIEKDTGAVVHDVNAIGLHGITGLANCKRVVGYRLFLFWQVDADHISVWSAFYHPTTRTGHQGAYCSSCRRS